jgi:hypothetical protein
MIGELESPIWMFLLQHQEHCSRVSLYSENVLEVRETVAGY